MRIGTYTDKKKDLGKFRKELPGVIMLIPMVIVLYIVIWRPQIMGTFWSFCNMRGYNAEGFAGLENYINVVTDTDFVKILLNTLKYVVWSLIIGAIPPIVLAILVNEVRKYQSFFRISLYIPSILPGIVVMIMWYLMYYPDSSGLLNSILIKFGLQPVEWLNNQKWGIPLIIIQQTWSGMGSTIILYLSALQGVKAELYEAAVLDGAGLFKRVFYVTIPQISGVIVLNIIMQIIYVFQILEAPMTMTDGGPNNATMSIALQMYDYGFVSGRIGASLALGTIVFLILSVFTLVYFKLNKIIEDNAE